MNEPDDLEDFHDGRAPIRIGDHVRFYMRLIGAPASHEYHARFRRLLPWLPAACRLEKILNPFGGSRALLNARVREGATFQDRRENSSDLDSTTRISRTDGGSDRR